MPGPADPSDEIPPSRSPFRSGSIHELAAGLTFEPDDDAVASDSRQMTSEPDQDRRATGLRGSCPDSLGDLQAGRMPSPPTLPDFLEPLPGAVLSDDLAFLVHKGALRIPGPPLRDAILLCYAHAVHPFMPVLDLGYFLDSIASNGTSGRVSLLLFQAVMFAGSCVVDRKLLREHGFDSGKHARKALFSRVRLLHDFAVESNQQVLMQSLLLMSLWYSGPDDPRTTWYYAGLACSTAYSIGLHRAPDPTDPHAKLRRRMWWSLYIRDRLIALATRRPMLIRDGEYTVPMLSPSDFERQDFSSLARPQVHDLGAPVIDPETCLPLMCVELAKLCVLAGRILRTFYTTLGRRNRWTMALMVVPKEDLDTDNVAASLETYDREITGWYNSMHPTIMKVRCTPFREGSEPVYNCLQQHWELIDMLRLTVITLLYRPQGFRTLTANGSCTAELIQMRQTSRKKLRAAARGLTLIGSNALLQGRVRFLTTSAIPAFLSAGLTHLLEIDSSDEDRRDAATLRFSQIVQVFRGLRDIYASADSSIQFLGRVVRKTGISARHSQIAALATEFHCTAAGRRNTAVRSAADLPVQRSPLGTDASHVEGNIREGVSDELRTGASGSSHNVNVHPSASIEASNVTGQPFGRDPADIEQSRDAVGDSVDLLSIFGPPLGSCVNLDYDLDSFDFDTGGLAWFNETFDRQPDF